VPLAVAYRYAVPPFFDGPLMLVIVIATAVWGPLRLREIELLLGKPVRSTRTGQAAKRLEQMKICALTFRGLRNITVELDRRHPMAHMIRNFALKLYPTYLAPFIVAVRPRNKSQIHYLVPATPKHDVASLDMHVLGHGPPIRMLHLLAQSRSMPAFAIQRFLGVSQANFRTIHKLEGLGILRTSCKGVDLYVRLNRSWYAHTALWDLLSALNQHLPEYEAMAEIDKRRRRALLYTWAKRVRDGRLRALGPIKQCSRPADVP